MQPEFDFSKEREEKIKQLGRLELAVRDLFINNPNLVSLKETNSLVREVWRLYGDYSCESITRCARKLRASGEFDHPDNVKHRANMEQGYRGYANE